MKKFLWAPSLWVGRQWEAILDYISEIDVKYNSRNIELKCKHSKIILLYQILHGQFGIDERIKIIII